MNLTPRLTEVTGDPCDTEGEPATTTEACYDGKKYTVKTDHSVVLRYRDAVQAESDLHWAVSWLGKCKQSPCDDLLEIGGSALITAWLHPQRDIDSSGAYNLQYVQDGQGGDPTQAQRLSTSQRGAPTLAGYGCSSIGAAFVSCGSWNRRSIELSLPQKVSRMQCRVYHH